jgi:hypothetical protein
LKAKVTATIFPPLTQCPEVSLPAKKEMIRLIADGVGPRVITPRLELDQVQLKAYHGVQRLDNLWLNSLT